MNSPVYFTLTPSPLGNLLLTASPRGLSGLWISGGKHCPDLVPEWQEHPACFTAVTTQLEEYFNGTRQIFDLPLDVSGTAFQQQAWAALQQSPYGTTLTYQQQATTMGRPAAVRAVGTANGRNPLSIIVPCHRVIGANGSLTGYGGGLPAKQWLLSHEAITRSFRQ
jgi:methylated-DNA-[protein]-cysteine S-methyltransferase